MSLVSPLAMQAFPLSGIQTAPASRQEFIAELLAGPVIVDESGEPTGERGPPYITAEDARRILEAK